MTAEGPSDDEAAGDDGAVVPITPETDAQAFDQLCLDLWRGGLSYAKVAEQLGVNRYTASTAAHRAAAREPDVEPAVRRRNVGARLDGLMGAAVTIAYDSTEPAETRLRAMNTFVQLADRYSRLWGTDIPVPKHVVVTEVTPEALAAERRRLTDELIAAGVKPELIPTPERILEIIEATATVEPTEDEPPAA